MSALVTRRSSSSWLASKRCPYNRPVGQTGHPQQDGPLVALDEQRFKSSKSLLDQALALQHHRVADVDDPEPVPCHWRWGKSHRAGVRHSALAS
jgi:hypothetical protein